MTLNHIGADDSLIRTDGMIVQAFDGTKTSMRENWFKVIIGPCEFEIPFVLVDIPVVFNLLLGRSWIHLAGAIPSSLHQKIKFTSSNKLIIMTAE